MTDQTHSDRPDQQLAGRTGWGWLLAIGIVLILGGIAGLLNPFVATLTATGIAAGAFLVGGIMQLVAAFRSSDDVVGSRWLAGAVGLLLIIFAGTLFLDPLGGVISLTLLVASLFLVLGIMRGYLAIRMRPRGGWGWMLASGVVSAGLGLFIFFTLPEGALAILGLLLSIELLASGAGLVGLAFARRRDA